MVGLKEIVKDRFLNEMIKLVNPASGHKVLVCDEFSVKVISAVLRMHEILEEGVTLVERFSSENLARQPLPTMDVIYFVQPTSTNVEKMLGDFKDAAKPMYANIHIFFTSGAPPAIMDMIADMETNPNFLPRVETCRELFLEFIAYESQTFTLGFPDAFSMTYGQTAAAFQEAANMFADRILTMCVSLGENPILRYSSKNRQPGYVAASLQRKLAAFYNEAPDLLDANRPRATLLIIDRSDDPVAPLLHEFTYQACCHELLPIINDKFVQTYETNTGALQTREVLLNETDPLWPTLRHMHLSESSQFVTQHYNEFMASNAEVARATSGEKGAVDLGSMKEAIRALPQYRELLAKYSLHIDLGTSCLAAFNKYNLSEIAMLEQDMVMGEDPSGAPVKKQVLNRLLTLFRADNLGCAMSARPTAEETETIMNMKRRLLMIYIITQEGIKESDRSALMEKAGLTQADAEMMANIGLLGVNLTQVNSGVFGRKSDKKKKRKTKKGSEVSFDVSRYTPIAKFLMEDACEGTLSREDYPFQGDDGSGKGSSSSGKKAAASKDKGEAVSVRNTKKPRWASKSGKKADEDEEEDDLRPVEVQTSGPRLIVFVLGGMTYSEMRSAYEVTRSEKREVLIGSTHIMRPIDFLNGLKAINDGNN